MIKDSTIANKNQFVRRLLSTRRSWPGLLVGAVLVAAVIAGLQGCANQAPDIDRMVMDAKTPADHEAIAAYYEKEASENQAEAASHRELGQTYEQHHDTYKNMMAPHCEIAADNYAKIAAEDTQLAAEHRKLAQQLK